MKLAEETISKSEKQDSLEIEEIEEATKTKGKKQDSLGEVKGSIAELTKILKKPCAYFKDDGDDDAKKKIIPNHLLPFDNFAQAVFDASEEILVKHLTKHKETKQTTCNSVRLAKAQTLKDGKKIRRVSTFGDTVLRQPIEDYETATSILICVICG